MLSKEKQYIDPPFSYSDVIENSTSRLYLISNRKLQSKSTTSQKRTWHKHTTSLNSNRQNNQHHRPSRAPSRNYNPRLRGPHTYR